MRSRRTRRRTVRDEPADNDPPWYSAYLSPPVRALLDRPDGHYHLARPRRAQVCILFTDIRGYTELSRTIDLEVLQQTVDAVAGQQSRLIARHGGYLDYFAGDGAMAVFEGVGMTGRACRCASAIIDVAADATAWPEQRPLPLGAGLHTGEVVLSSLGSEERRIYTAIGETVNIAARLSDQAEPWSLLTTGPVLERLTPGYRRGFEAMPAATPRGVARGVGIYRLRSR